MHLLQRLHDVTDGDIRIGGPSIAAVTEDSLRARSPWCRRRPAHRLSKLAAVGRVLVMVEGRIVEDG